jgi:hypothetical protein
LGAQPGAREEPVASRRCPFPPRADRLGTNPAFGADPAFDLNQAPAQDPTEPEPVPDFDFVPSAGA